MNDVKSKRCLQCGFVYYFNPAAAVACFLRDAQGRLLVARRACDPGRGMLDLPGGFVDCAETAEEAARREVREETGLQTGPLQYLFSVPNIYPYSGFEVHTLDLFFEGRVPSFEGCCPQDDVCSLEAVTMKDVRPEQFGLTSIAAAVRRYVDAAQRSEQCVADDSVADD